MINLIRRKKSNCINLKGHSHVDFANAFLPCVFARSSETPRRVKVRCGKGKGFRPKNALFDYKRAEIARVNYPLEIRLECADALHSL